jgi:hypothetical protein
VMAAKPKEPPMPALRNWIAALEKATMQDDRATIRAVLEEAGSLNSNPTRNEQLSGPRKPYHRTGDRNTAEHKQQNSDDG